MYNCRVWTVELLLHLLRYDVNYLGGTRNICISYTYWLQLVIKFKLSKQN